MFGSTHGLKLQIDEVAAVYGPDAKDKFKPPEHAQPPANPCLSVSASEPMEMAGT